MDSYKLLCLLCWGSILVTRSATNSPMRIIKLGALIDKVDMEFDKEQDVAYDFAKGSVNRDVVLMTSMLELKTKHVRDSFETSGKVCSLSREPGERDRTNGVAAIFGPYEVYSSNYVRSFGAAFRIPHIQFHPDFSPLKESEIRQMDLLSLNFWPDIEQIALAYKQLAEEFRWQKIIILTTGTTGSLPLLKYLLDYDLKKEVFVREINSPKDGIKELKTHSEFKIVILDLELDECTPFITAANESGLLSGYYHFHFTSMDIFAESEEIGHMATGAVNVTFFSIIQHTSSPEFKDMENSWREMKGKTEGFNIMRKTRNALIYDSIKYVTLILAKHRTAVQGFTTEKMNCNGEEKNQWKYGDSVYKQLITNASRGVTGEIRFDEYGRRRDFTLSLLEFDIDGKVQQVGSWSPSSGLLLTKTFDKVKEEVGKDLSRKKFKIAVRAEQPFVNISEYDEMGRYIPEERKNERFTGYCIEMMAEIAKIVNMSDYEFVEVTSGSSLGPDGKWSGIIGGLMSLEYDIGLSPITVTHERSEVVDFTINYMDLGISILFKKDPEIPPKIFAFMEPFEMTLWLAIGGAFLVTSLLLHIFARFSPGQWDNPHKCSPNVQLLENDLTPSNSMWFTLASFLCQGTEIMPKAAPTRITATFWWLFCLICVASYTANLAAFLTKSKMKLQINNADDLAKQSKIMYGCFAKGSTREFFRKSNISTYSQINNFMEETQEEHNVQSSAIGISKVLEGGYAFIMESMPLRYALTENCDLVEVGKELNSMMYSVALPKHSPYTRDISDAILKIKEDQKLLTLYNKWWKVESNECKREKSDSAIESSKLGLANFAGVFIILLTLLVFALIVLVIEFIIGAYQDSKENETSFCHEVLRNLRFSCNCCENEDKPVNEKTKDEENDEYSLDRSLDRISLSTGSLHSPHLDQENKSTSPSKRQNIEKRKTSQSLCSTVHEMDITKETVTTTGSQHSLMTIKRPHVTSL